MTDLERKLQIEQIIKLLSNLSTKDEIKLVKTIEKAFIIKTKKKNGRTKI